MHHNTNKYTVVVGMSGGVDSAVAALLLKQQGFKVIGVFMKNWEEDDDPLNNYCGAAKDLADAKLICDILNIELFKVNFATEYWDKVFQIFLQEYQAGRTPNPDLLCNKEIKFKVFLNYAKSLQADFIATGHYARVDHKTNQTKLLIGLDPNKDQSYFLHALTQAQLKNCLFPIGDLQKSEVRAIAKQANFPNYNKKDSTGICFIGERKFKDFLAKYLPPKPGLIITEQGEPIGTHAGIMYYTIGQRHGLKIGGQSTSCAWHAPWYVIAKDLSNNQLIVAQGKNHPRLFAKKLLAINPHWINTNPFIDPKNILTCTAKIRYRQTSQSCSVTVNLNHTSTILVTFTKPQRAITPGQYIVFYQGSECLGGATIEQAI